MNGAKCVITIPKEARTSEKRVGGEKMGGRVVPEDHVAKDLVIGFREVWQLAHGCIRELPGAAAAIGGQCLMLFAVAHAVHV